MASDISNETSSTISIDRFGTALNAAYNDAEFRDPETKKKRIEVRERDSFTECQVCSDLQLQMGLAKSTSAFVHAKEQFDSHNASQKAEREKSITDIEITRKGILISTCV